jgi:hypothetical protein
MEDAANIETQVTEGGAEITTPAAPTLEAAPTAPSFADIVPAEYKDAEWVKTTKDTDSFFKQFSDLKSKIGSLPAKAPENAEGYTFAEVEGVEADADFQGKISAALLDAGINQDQFSKLESVYNGLLSSGQDASKQADVDFDALANSTFGEDRQKVMDQTQGLLKQYTPESMTSHVAGLSNEALIIMSGVLNGMAKEYMGEDSIPTGKGSATAASSEATRRTEGKNIMQSEAWKDPRHPGHAEAVAKVQQLYGT